MSHLLLMNVRAPIHQQSIVQYSNAATSRASGEEEERPETLSFPRTRCGYIVGEAYHTYEQSLGESGAAASGKALHFAADLICSGGLDIWIRGAYSYAVQKVGLANPRIFVYLRQRIADLDRLVDRLPNTSFYTHPEVQSIVSEVVLVLQLCPKHMKLAWPKIDEHTRRPGWISAVAAAPETRATATVFDPEGDSATLYYVGNALCKAVQEGQTAQALFWIRWTLDEDARLRKETKVSGLSRIDRNTNALQPKARTDAGHFLAAVFTEIYKELVSKNLVRMNEEYAELLRLWKDGEKRMAARLKRDCLGWMAMLCCEVPRWKVPACPPLVSDPVRLSRAVTQAGSFFTEVLAYSPLPINQELKPKMMKIPKTTTKKKLTDKEKAKMEMDSQFDLYEAAMSAYLGKK
jgi:hypothetical protein